MTGGPHGGSNADGPTNNPVSPELHRKAHAKVCVHFFLHYERDFGKFEHIARLLDRQSAAAVSSSSLSVFKPTHAASCVTN